MQLHLLGYGVSTAALCCTADPSRTGHKAVNDFERVPCGARADPRPRASCPRGPFSVTGSSSSGDVRGWSLKPASDFGQLRLLRGDARGCRVASPWDVSLECHQQLLTQKGQENHHEKKQLTNTGFCGLGAVDVARAQLTVGPRTHSALQPHLPCQSPPPGSSPLWLPALSTGSPTGDPSKRPGGRSRGQTEVILRLSVPPASARLCQQLPSPSEPRVGPCGICFQGLCSLPHVVFSPKTCDLRRSPYPPLGEPTQVR